MICGRVEPAVKRAETIIYELDETLSEIIEKIHLRRFGKMVQDHTVVSTVSEFTETVF